MPKVEFQVIYPDSAPGEYGSKEDPSPYISLANEKEWQDNLINPNEIVIKSKDIRVLFDYPLSKPHVVTFHNDSGFTRYELADIITKHYQFIYQRERETSSLKEETSHERYGNRLLNRAETNGEFGIWGHVLEDLLLHKVTYDKAKKYYTLSIDS